MKSVTKYLPIPIYLTVLGVLGACVKHINIFDT